MVPQSQVTLQQFPQKAVDSYGEIEFSRLDRKLAMFHALSPEDRDVLPEFEERISALAECIESNATLLSIMAQSAQAIQSPASRPDPLSTPQDDPATPHPNGSEDEILPKDDPVHEAEEKQHLSRAARRGFTLLARDWSIVGAQQRATMYGPLIGAVERAYDEAARAKRSLSRSGFRVLVPGAGAGRLPWELVRRGFAVEGCELSFTALLVGNFVLNGTSGAGVSTIYPFAHEHCNVRSREMACRGVQVPDVNPKEIPDGGEFAIRAGRFVEAYEGQDCLWDAVVGCLAFDLGDGVVGHVRRVAQILKPGGVWTFIGPGPCLDGGQVDGIHLSVEEFLGIVRKCGFKIVRREQIECLHSADPESLRSIHLNCLFVVAVKIRPAV